MRGTEHCDEIIRLIDEVLGEFPLSDAEGQGGGQRRPELHDPEFAGTL